MLQLFVDGQPESLSGAAAAGGLLVRADGPADITALIDHCLALRRDRAASWNPWFAGPSEDTAQARLRKLYGRLLAGDISGNPAHAGANERREFEIADLVQSSSRDAFDGLLLSLAALLAFWEVDGREDDAPLGLSLLLVLAAPASTGAAPIELRFEKPTAMLSIRPGSLIEEISVGTWLKAARWGAVVVSTVSGKNAKAAAHELVEGARQRARSLCQYDFARLDQLLPDDIQRLRAKSLVVVLLHGLCSSDLLTFDGWIKRLHSATPQTIAASLGETVAAPHQLVRNASNLDRVLGDLNAALVGREAFAQLRDFEVRRFVEQEVGLLGWPHNSLASIEANARELHDLIEQTIGLNGPRIVFVCHSRGGLLARAVAAKLLLRSSPAHDWGAVLADIITFGTPHEGAALAEPRNSTARDVATYLMMYSATKKLVSLQDVLVYLDSRTSEGIENLKPADATTEPREHSFVSNLFEAEADLRARDGLRRPPILAVGGKTNATVLETWKRRAVAAMVSRKLGGEENDLVVELSSSVSKRVAPDVSVVVAADHFSYFDAAGESGRAIDVSVARVWSRLASSLARWTVANAAIGAGPAQGAPGGAAAPDRDRYQL